MGPRARLIAALFGIGLSFVLHSWASGFAVADELVGGPACPKNGPDGVCFGMPPIPSGGIVRQINLRAPGPGQALVTVSGSGWCVNSSTTADKAADFATQIVDRPDDAVDPRGPGGLRFQLRMQRAADAFTGVFVPINFGASRVFRVRRARTERFYLKLATAQLELDVTCHAYSLNMTVLFVAD